MQYQNEKEYSPPPPLAKQYAPSSRLGVLDRNKLTSRGILNGGFLMIGALKCWERRKREATALRCFTK